MTAIANHVRRLRGVAIAMLLVLAAVSFVLGFGPLMEAGERAGMTVPLLVQSWSTLGSS